MSFTDIRVYMYMCIEICTRTSMNSNEVLLSGTITPREREREFERVKILSKIIAHVSTICYPAQSHVMHSRRWGIPDKRTGVRNDPHGADVTFPKTHIPTHTRTRARAKQMAVL